MLVLADRLLIPRLQNEIVKNILERKNSGAEIISMLGADSARAVWIWENTVKGSKLRVLFCDMCAFELGVEHWPNLARAPRELLYKIGVVLKDDSRSFRNRRTKKKLKAKNYFLTVPKR
jgi:hypothetical protein